MVCIAADTVFCPADTICRQPEEEYRQHDTLYLCSRHGIPTNKQGVPSKQTRYPVQQTWYADHQIRYSVHPNMRIFTLIGSLVRTRLTAMTIVAATTWIATVFAPPTRKFAASPTSTPTMKINRMMTLIPGNRDRAYPVREEPNIALQIHRQTNSPALNFTRQELKMLM